MTITNSLDKLLDVRFQTQGEIQTINQTQQSKYD